jgi:hypothetical protein
MRPWKLGKFDVKKKPEWTRPKPMSPRPFEPEYRDCEKDNLSKEGLSRKARQLDCLIKPPADIVILEHAHSWRYLLVTLFRIAP